MANIPLFSELQTKARKDPLGYNFFNALALNQTAIDRMHVVEHLDSGEHNAAEIGRLNGKVRWTGAAYTLEGFNAYATGTSNPAVGDLKLTIASGALLDPDHLAVDILNMSQTGSTKPCITVAQVNSDTEIEFFSTYLSSALGAGNTWAAEDANFSVSIHSVPQVVSYTAVNPPAALARGGYLSQTNYNTLVQASGALMARYKVGHNGVIHNVREVARVSGIVGCSGTTYTVASDADSIDPVTRNGLGDVTVPYTYTLTSPINVFAHILTPPDGTYIAYAVGCPRSTAGPSSTRLYFYGFDGTNWARVDVSFFISVHGA